jgi:hypothetical protein
MAGAFRAVNGGDVGSPGYIDNPPPRFLSLTWSEEQVVLKCRAVEGKTYALRSKTRLGDPYWGTVGIYSSDNAVLTITFAPDNTAAQEFFLLEEIE